jgi:TRAP-type C4-dicarboxylate transport system permease small subunit
LTQKESLKIIKRIAAPWSILGNNEQTKGCDKDMLKFFDVFEDRLIKLSLAIMVVFLSIQVFLRYALNISLDWIEEVSRYGFIWFCYLGASLAAKNRGHIRLVRHLEILLGEKWQYYITVLADMLWVFFNVVMLFFQIKFVILMFTSRPYYSSVLGLNRAYIYLVIPFSFILLTVRILLWHWEHIKSRKENK